MPPVRPPLLLPPRPTCFLFFLLFLSIIITTTPHQATAAAATTTRTTTSARVQQLLGNLTLEERIGQMLQLDILSILNPGTLEVNQTRLTTVFREYHVGSLLNSPFTLGPAGGKDGWNPKEWKEIIRAIHQTALDEGAIPALYGIDSVHGANLIYGATIFPQQINGAASFNRDLVYDMGRVTGKDTKAAGIPWLFSPILGINTQPLWSRSYETFGECPHVAAEMGKAIIRGIQVEQDPAFPGLPRAAACMKHFITYPAAVTGHDRSPIELDERTVLQLYAPPFRAAVQEAEVLSAMEAYIEVSGVPMASSKQYLVDLLRGDMDFKNMLVTDYNEIGNLHQFHMVAEDMKEAVRLAMVDTSIDMSMNPPVPKGLEFYNSLLQLVKEGKVSESRVDASVARVLELKEKLGLLEKPLSLLDEFPEVEASVGSKSDREAALALARESIVLLENKRGLLPLRANSFLGKKIFVTGQGCNSLGMQSGGWTLHWQGAKRNSVFTYGSTFYEGIMERFRGAEVWYHPGVTVEGTWVPGQEEVLHHAGHADLIVACVGEHPYAEKPGDIEELSLPQGQLDYIARLTEVAQDSATPLVAVLVEGRARLLGSALDKADAVLDAMLVGPSGGQALAEILAGDVNPSARLPFTYPHSAGNTPEPYYRKPSSLCTTGHQLQPFKYIQCPRQWEFGHGLSYTTFTYSNVTLSAATIDESTPLDVSVTVTNTGRSKGKEVVLLFLTDKVRRVSPEYKMLKGFEKIELAPGEAKVVSFTLSPDPDLLFVGVERRRVLQSGMYLVGFGAEVDCRAKPEEGCSAFSLQLSEKYDAVCEATCRAWKRAGIEMNDTSVLPKVFQALASSQAHCQETCLAYRQTETEEGQGKGEGGWSYGYVQCLEQHLYQKRYTQMATKCWHPFASFSAAASSACPLTCHKGSGNGTDDDNNNNNNDNNNSNNDTNTSNSIDRDAGKGGEVVGFLLAAVCLVVGIVCAVIKLGNIVIFNGSWRERRDRHRRTDSGGSVNSSRSGSATLPLLDVGEEEGGGGRGEGEDEEGGGGGGRRRIQQGPTEKGQARVVA